jgi:hypothetical protein
MTTKETAAYLTRLGIETSPRTLEDWRHKGTGPDYVRIEGRRVRYEPTAVRVWLSLGERKTAGRLHERPARLRKRRRRPRSTRAAHSPNRRTLAKG